MRSRRDPWRGAAAGLLGGIAASFAMNRFHALWTKLAEGGGAAQRKGEQGGQVKKSEQQRRPENEEEESATEKAAARLARLLFHRDLGEKDKKKAGALLHYAFGGAAGALFGAAAELAPSLACGGGIPFGAAVWLAADEVATPALGLAKPPTEYPISAHLQSLAAHAVYGAATDLVRRLLRG